MFSFFFSVNCHLKTIFLLVRDTIVVPSAYWPPESKMHGSLSVTTMLVSLNISKSGSAACGPNATFVFNDRPRFDSFENLERSISSAAETSVIVSSLRNCKKKSGFEFLVELKMSKVLKF